MILVQLSPLANHLWQSTLFAAVAALLALALRRNRSQIRYWLWYAASLKFLLPFSILFSIGTRVEWTATPLRDPPLPSAIGQFGQPFAIPTMPLIASRQVPDLWTPAPVLILAAWLIGSAAILILWCTRYRTVRRALREATLLPIDAPVPVLSTPSPLEPGVFGIFRPVLLVPEGLASRLPPDQFRAILAHELWHLRRRDNLAALLHMFVEAMFWFHPAVWWIGAKLVEERERACDEEVLRQIGQPEEYATGILNVCKFYLE